MFAQKAESAESRHIFGRIVPKRDSVRRSELLICANSVWKGHEKTCCEGSEADRSGREPVQRTVCFQRAVPIRCGFSGLKKETRGVSGHVDVSFRWPSAPTVELHGVHGGPACFADALLVVSAQCPLDRIRVWLYNQQMCSVRKRFCCSRPHKTASGCTEPQKTDDPSQFVAGIVCFGHRRRFYATNRKSAYRAKTVDLKRPYNTHDFLHACKGLGYTEKVQFLSPGA